MGKIIEINNPAEDYFTVTIDVGDNYKFEPGQFTKFSLPSKNIKNGSNFRIFSICSSKNDGTVMIAVKSRGEDISDFKKLLLSLKAGDEIEISKPMGSFTVKDKLTPMIMFATGVGITPIMSVLGSIKNETDRPIIIVYASEGYFLFKNVLTQIAKDNPKVTLYTTNNIKEAVNLLMRYADEYKNSAYYYISGFPNIVKEVEERYLQKDIEKAKILSDKFTGY